MRRAFSRGFHAALPEPARYTAILSNGARIDLLEPKNLGRAIPAIPAHLAVINRYAGATYLPYTVAQHSAILAQECVRRASDGTRAMAGLYALYHDAHEAIIGDITVPMERAIDFHCPGIVEQIRRRIDAALYPALGLDWPVPPDIQALIDRAHDELVAAEMRDLSSYFAPELQDYERRGVRPLRACIRPLPWTKAMDLFAKTRTALLIEAGLAP